MRTAHGHVLNVAEACDDSGNGIIVHATVEPNIKPDSRMAEEYMRQISDHRSKQTLIADGAYNSNALEKTAAVKNVEIYTTSLTGKAPENTLADFTLNKDGTEILYSPTGKEPTGCKYNANSGYITAAMPGNCCASCPHKDKCRAKANNKKHKSTVRVTRKMVAPQDRHEILQLKKGRLTQTDAMAWKVSCLSCGGNMAWTTFPYSD